MMKRLVLLCCVIASPALAQTEKTRLIDLTADTLRPRETEIGIFWGRVTRRVGPVQLSAQLAPYLLSMVNATAKVQWLDRSELRFSTEVGAYWMTLLRVAGITLLSVPADARATLPLGGPVELSLGAGFHWLKFDVPGQALDVRSTRAEAVLVRYDTRGAFLLIGRAPLWRTQEASLQSTIGSRLSGALSLDDMDAWSVLIARDHVVGKNKNAHLRFGLGYRNRPGIVLVESFGNLLLDFQMYWRVGGDK